jgi:hypothetical protein
MNIGNTRSIAYLIKLLSLRETGRFTLDSALPIQPDVSLAMEDSLTHVLAYTCSGLYRAYIGVQLNLRWVVKEAWTLYNAGIQ